MKMVMAVHSKASGIINHVQVGGAILNTGDLIARLVLDDPDKVKTATPCTTPFPHAHNATQPPNGHVHQQLKHVLAFLHNTLQGFAMPEPFYVTKLQVYLDLLIALCNNPLLPLLEARDILSSLNGRIATSVAEMIERELVQYERSTSSIMCRFPTQKLASIIDAHATTLEQQEQDAFFLHTAPLQMLIQRYRFGLNGFFVQTCCQLIKKYLEVEKKFAVKNVEAVVKSMNAKNPDDLRDLVGTLISHKQIKPKNELVIGLVDRMFASGNTLVSTPEQSKIFQPSRTPVTKNQDALILEQLEELAALSTAGSSSVALKARVVLVKLHVPAFEKRRKAMEDIFLQAPKSIEQVCGVLS